MPKRRRSKPVAGLGWGPTMIILLVLIASLYANFLGRSLVQLAIRLAIVAAITASIYLLWYEMAIRNPAFRMGVGGESTIILAIVAAGLIFVADPVATSVGLALVPNYSYLQVTGGIQLDLANSQIISLFLIAGFILLLVLMFLMLRRRKSK